MPLVLVLLVAEDAAGRFMIGIGLDGVQRKAIGQRRLWWRTQRWAKRRVPRLGPAAVSTTGDATRPDRPMCLPAGAACRLPRQHGQPNGIRIVVPAESKRFSVFLLESPLAAPVGQPIEVGRVAGFQACRFADNVPLPLRERVG